MNRFTAIIWIILAVPSALYGQVDKIKEASKSSGSRDRSGSSGSSGNSFLGSAIDVLLYVPRREYMEVQTFQAPDTTSAFQFQSPLKFSLEAIGEVGLKTGGGYMFWPRLRANFGIISTDYRVNYMVEKDKSGATSDLRTNDWQILHLNLLQSSVFTIRLGGGIMYEMFGDQHQYPEFTAGLAIHPPDISRYFTIEYRSATDDGSSVRKEFSASYQFRFFRLGVLHGYLGIGLTYQEYYGSISVFAVHAGIAFRIFNNRLERY